MSDKADLLFELGTEELPPLALERLATALFQELGQLLNKDGFHFDTEGSRWFATPRRLALRLHRIDTRQPDRMDERRGPALQAAFDDQGRPTPAALGFARSCGVEVDQLERRETEKGAWLYHRREVQGQPLAERLPDLLQQALDRLPIPKRMRWGSHDFQFVRPVHWLVCLLDEQVLPVELFGLQAGCESRGHRFMHPSPVRITHAGEYETALEAAFVQVCPEKRRQAIREQCERLAREQKLRVRMHDAVLDEVVNLVEWPVAVSGRFDEDFLVVPAECLITSMEEHQRFFPLTDQAGRLAARFIGVANVESPRPEVIASGYEKVIRPRLADARFFWDNDRKKALIEYQPLLAEMTFQKKLGTLLDKTQRLETLAQRLAPLYQADPALCRRAAALCKCDLVTDMVYEFTELQGVMGRYYALESGENEEVAQAIEDHYHPRFAGDSLARGPVGLALGLADRLDTLCGIFAIGQKPSGNKDPFALRRAALGIIRMLVEPQVEANIRQLLQQALEQLPIEADEPEVLLKEIQDFLQERLRGWLGEQGYAHGVIEAVLAVQPHNYHDLVLRLQALQALQGSEPMQSLAQANKRINNILKKQAFSSTQVDENLFRAEAERALFSHMLQSQPELEQHLARKDYQQALSQTAKLQQPVNRFFDEVMVMDEDARLRNNRLALLCRLRQMLRSVAELAHLEG